MSEKMRQLKLHKGINKRLEELQKEVDNKPHYSELPVTANLLKDTKQFKNLCGGQMGTEMKWDDTKKKVFGGEWEAFLGLKDTLGPIDGRMDDLTVDASIQVLPISPESTALMHSENAYGELSAFINTDRVDAKGQYDGCSVHALVMDVTISTDAKGKACLYMPCQSNTPMFTSDNSTSFGRDAER